MSIKTSKERKRDAIIGWIITIIIIAGICWGGHKLFGWGNNWFNRISDTTNVDSVSIETEVVHDTLTITNIVYKDSIKLEYKNGHHYMTVNINGVKIKGLMDSGCTAGIGGCSIDYAFLERHGYIKHSHPGEAVIANGDTINSIFCTAYNVSIDNIRFDSVECSFVDSQNAEVLIGQGILKQLGAYVIDYNSHMMYIK